MASRGDYTIHDADGAEVRKGDQVTITMTGEVRSVSRDGLVVVQCPDGTITAYYPKYQTLRRA